MNRRVVITGCGVVSSLGDSPRTLHEALLDGASGISALEGFDTQGLGCNRAGEIKEFKPRDYLGRRNLRALDRTGGLVTTAAALALDDAGLDVEDRDKLEVGLVLGTMYGSVGTIAAFDRRATEAGPEFASPFDFANSVINAAAGQAAIWHGLRGVNSTIACGAASGLRAVAYASELIASGRADVVLAGGGEELCAASFLAFERSGRLSPTATENATCTVPLHKERSGFLLGEGAGLVVLEAADTAAARGAEARAVVRGSGSAFEPSLGSDEAQGVRAAERSLRQALESGGLVADEIAGLSLGADGSADDILEAQAMVRVLGARSRTAPATAIAGALGQCLGGGGGLQMVVAVESLRSGRLPGIAGLDTVDDGCELRVGPTAVDVQDGALLLKGHSFDGHHCSVALARAGV